MLLLVQQQIHPKVMTNMLKKVFKWPEFHPSGVTSYKIYTLVSIDINLYQVVFFSLDWQEIKITIQEKYLVLCSDLKWSVAIVAK